jgi:hypothetical protein
METIKKDDFVACFVNTNQSPLSRKFLGLKVVEDDREMVVSVFEEVRYPHPDAPDHATIPVQENRIIKRIASHKEEAAACKMFIMAHNALKFQLQREIVFH